MITNIIALFRKEPHQVNFIIEFSKALEENREVINGCHTEAQRDYFRRQDWEFKRWFWSFLENAVPLHTKTIHVTKAQLQNYDVALVVKSLKSFGVEIKEE